ncbi:MAG: 2-hydroxycarboxylate transporter family protein [Acholeplasma sp.]|jgi:CCS family citrate carrier protein|nr:2-hydroxycarboxylate transporter family protein [Acholeplasma sp.]
MNKIKHFLLESKVMGLPWLVFIVIGVVLYLATILGVIPTGMVGAFAVMIFLGALLGFIGDHTPIIKDYFGGGPIVIIFGVAAMVYFKWMPAEMIRSINSFMTAGALKNGTAIVGYKAGFLDFYIAALITGSILGMNKKLLIKASLRYFPVVIGATLVALLLAATFGFIMGFGFQDGLFFIGMPIMGGGMGAGAVPLSTVMSEVLNQPAEEILSKLVPALALANAMAIVFAGLLDKLGKKVPSLTGNGKLMMGDQDFDFTDNDEKLDDHPSHFGVGLLVALTFMVFGTIIEKYVPDIHFYAWMIISVGVVKALGILPRKIELAAQKWYQFVAANFTLALLVGIGISYVNLGQIIDSISFTYVVLVLVTVIGAMVGAGVVGRLMGLYPIEAAITGGLCMANMGGTGDVAVLGASKRMELMPFAQISSRIGGAFILLLTSLLLMLFS